MKLVSMLIIFMFGSEQILKAAGPISLQAALDSARQNNLNLRTEKLSTEYLAALKKSYMDIPKSTLSYESGQINSMYTDHRFGISQNLQFPLVYSRQRNLLEQTHVSGLLRLNLSGIELDREVRSTYYRLNCLLARKKLLMSTDSSYAEMMNKAGQKFKSGETNAVEFTSTSIQRQQIAFQLSETIRELESQQLRFRFLLNSHSDWEPEPAELKLELPLPDSTVLSAHPSVNILRQEIKLNDAAYSLAKSKFLPDIFLAYSDMSMKGYGADNNFYTGSTRFRSYTVGIGIPIFSGAQRSQVMATELNRKRSENAYRAGQLNLNMQWEQAILKAEHYRTMLLYYDSVGLDQLETLSSSIALQLEKGEISYTDWVVHNAQVYTGKLQYLDILNNYNDAMIELRYLMGN